MPIDPGTLEAVKTDLNGFLNLAGTIGGTVAPEFIPFIALGKALAAAAPDLYADAQKLFSGTPPAQADIDALAEDIHALANPETA